MRNDSPASRLVYGRWVLANGAAEAVGLGGTLVLGRLLAPQLSDKLGTVAILAGAAAAVLLGVLLEGVVVGWAQARVLGPALPELPSRDWIVATAIGAGAAWTLGMVPSTLMALLNAPSSPGTPAPAEPARLVQYGLALLLGAVTGPILGYMQMRVLRRHVVRAARWLWANSAAWAAGMLLIFVGMDPLPWAAGGWPLSVGLVLVAGLAGTAVGAVHGRVLLALLRDRRRPILAT